MGTIPEPTGTFGQLWKMVMNRTPLPQTAGVVNAPKTASSDLIRQATRKLLKGEDRKSVMRQLATSTRRSPAAVVAAPAPPPVAAPSAAPVATGSGQGSSGYRGNNASQLEHPSNPGWATAAAPPPHP